MNIINELIVPQFNSKPLYDGGYISDRQLIIELKTEKVSFSLLDIIDSVPSLNQFNSEEMQWIKKHYGIGYAGRSHDGGGPVFLKKVLKGEHYIFYFGVNEIANSHYLVYCHGVLIYED